MYLKQSKTRRGKIFLSFVQGYRDENNKVRQKTVENIGWLDELSKRYKDPIKHFKEVAKKRTKEEINELNIKNLNSIKVKDGSISKNLGYFILKDIYNELDIKSIFKEKQKNSKIKYDLNDIFSFLVYIRIINPSSKKGAYENRNLLFEKSDFTLDDIYRSLTILNPLQEKIQQKVCQQTEI